MKQAVKREERRTLSVSAATHEEAHRRAYLLSAETGQRITVADIVSDALECFNEKRRQEGK
ncbi:MAG: hypothetical protein ACXV3U_06410 [Halobacteriota archaeon]